MRWLVPQSDLEELLTDWSEDRSVGDVILKYVSTSFLLERECRQTQVNLPLTSDAVVHQHFVLSSVLRSAPRLTLVICCVQSKELVKAYPPFVNFFEMSKDTIISCEKQKPRFHAFLKV